MATPRYKKVLVIFLLILVATGPILTPFSQGFSFPEKYDLVAILVEQGLYSDIADRTGLADQVGNPITATTNKRRVDQYAIDVQNALPGTRAVIIQVDRFEKTENVAAVLERLYFDGDPDQPTRIAHLTGVVIIGEVPLPIINKGGNRYLSMFPYTDFADPAYFLSHETGDFELQADIENPQPEVWHGVIRPPVSTQSDEGKELLATYLDKNHLYHIGDDRYADFSKRIFFQDFVEETKNLNADAFSKYQNFLNHQGDVAYLRYTRDLFKDLSGPADEELSALTDSAAASQQALAELGIPVEDAGPDAPINPEHPEAASQTLDKNAIPDILTKVYKMSDNLMMRFNQVFTKYPSLINDFVKYTGRYVTPNGDDYDFGMDSAINLITAKDQYTLSYLKAVNTMLEEAIDRAVARVQKPVAFSKIHFEINAVGRKQEDGTVRDVEPIAPSATISIEELARLLSPGVLLFDPVNGARRLIDDQRACFIQDTPGIPAELLRIFNQSQLIPSNKMGEPIDFINYSPQINANISNNDLPCPYTVKNRSDSEVDVLPAAVNGNPLDSVTSVAQCAVLRGSHGADGSYSKVVEMSRALDLNTGSEYNRDVKASTGRTKGEIDTNYQCFGNKTCEAYENFGGCFYGSGKRYPPPAPGTEVPLAQQSCFAYHATDNLIDPAGTREITGEVPTGYDDYRACMNYNSESALRVARIAADQRLEVADDVGEDAPTDHEELLEQFADPARLPVTDPEPHPDDFVIFKSKGGDNYEVTMGDLLLSVGWNSADNPLGYKAVLADLLNRPARVGQSDFTINIIHPKIAYVKISIGAPEVVKEISSIFPHKEPTVTTLNAQARSLIAQDLPVDNPRYVTFQSQAGNPEKIVYPDLFKAQSPEEFFETLQQAQTALNRIPVGALGGVVCDHCLENLIANLPDVNQDQVGPEDLLTRANRLKVLDAVNWKNMDIDAKHAYLVNNYLDGRSDTYVGKSEHGYELAYFNGEGDARGYTFALSSAVDLDDQIASAKPVEEEEYQDDPNNPFDDLPADRDAGAGGYDLFTFSLDPDPVSPWYERFTEWKDDLENQTNFEVSLGEPADDFYGKLDAENAKELEKIKAESTAAANDPLNADSIQTSRIKTLVLNAQSLVVAPERTVEILTELKDEAGAVVSDEFAKVTATVTSQDATDARLLNEDENPNADGVQLTVIGGRVPLKIATGAKPGTVQVQIKLDDTELTGSGTLSVVAGAHLKLESATLATTAGGGNRIDVDVSAVDANDVLIPSARDAMIVASSDNAMADLAAEKANLVGGRARLSFTVGRKAGTVVLSATTSTLDAGTFEFDVLPAVATKVGLTASAAVLPSVPGQTVDLFATLFDRFGNVVDTNSNLTAAFVLSEKSQRFASLTSADVQFANGIAKTTLQPRDRSGKIEVTATVEGLPIATTSLDSALKFSAANLKVGSPNSLAVALLGIPAGDVTQSDFLAGWYTMRGKTQVATTMTAAPKQFKKILEVTALGGLRMPEAGRVEARFIPANNFTMALRDTRYGTDLGQVTMVIPENGQFAILEKDDTAALSDGIYLRKMTTDASYQIDRTSGALRIAKEDQQRFEIQTNGFIRIFDSAYTVQPKDADGLTLQVLDGKTVVAEVLFVQHYNQPVRLLEGARTPSSDVPGVYLKKLSQEATVQLRETFSGNSTALPTGFGFFDLNEALTGTQAPGFAAFSLEDSVSKPGVGFTQDNKFALLFASGETFGESNRLYSSDIGIVIGDPTVRVTREQPARFSQDVGKLLYSAATDVNTILPLDYNTDGLEDILLAEEDGHVRLIENNGGYDALRDAGYIMNIKSGIQDITKVDVNVDGQMDVVIAAKESCKVGDTCIDVYENHGGSFVRHNIQIDQPEKILTLKAQDMNADRFPDLIFADAAGDIKILYNRQGSFAPAASVIGNVGLQLDPAKNLAGGLFVRYDGMRLKDEEDPRSVLKYRSIEYGGEEGRDFIKTTEDAAAFHRSTKHGEDLNGGTLRSGDRIRYSITLTNDLPVSLSNVVLSDVVGEGLELDRATIACAECGEDGMEIEDIQPDPTRPFVIKGMTVPARRTHHITYEVTYKPNTDTSSRVTLSFKNNFQDTNPLLQARLSADELPDIAVSKEGNTSGMVRYFISTGAPRDGIVRFNSELSTPSAPNEGADILAHAGINIPNLSDFDHAEDGPPEAMTRALTEQQTSDKDGDGLQDAIDDVNGALDDINAFTANAINNLTCDAGCVALPLNYAFFAPGFASVFGVPVSYDPGLPVFGFGVPSLVPVWPPSGTPSFGSMAGRFYVSPTLTGGVGFSVCFNAFGTPKNCFSFGINALDLLPGNICDKLNGKISGALAKANDAIADVNEGLTISVGGSSTGGGSGDDGSGMVNYSLGSYTEPVATSHNIKVPGFPQVLTDWYTHQMEEIVDSATDVPDLYFIYPSLDSITGSFIPTLDLEKEGTGDVITNILSKINSIPLVDIQTQEVLFKVPLLTRNEIELIKADGYQWVEDEKLELNKWMSAIGCFADLLPDDFNAGDVNDPNRPPVLPVNHELCNFVSAEMNKLIDSVIDNMKRLDEWILFPKKVLQFRAIESYYLGQIVDYFDQVINFTGGWIKKNTARVKQWRRAVRDMKDAIKNWKPLINLMIDYNESCDTCKTERYGLMELVLKLFIAIPSPPVIPLPKLPDIVLDVSKIQAGITIHWPDVQFKPTPFIIPKLPRIKLGIDLTLPLFKAVLPEIPKLPDPPTLPSLPPLPPLNLPKLPDLPPPPTLPGLPNQLNVVIDILKKVMKLICLIKLGFVPTDEYLLKSRIEQITARGLTPILPVDLLFAIQSPSIKVKYMDQLVVTAMTNLNFDTKFIQEAVESFAAAANKNSTDLTKAVNQYLDALFKQVEKVTSPTINLEYQGPEGRQLNYDPAVDILKLLSKGYGETAPEVVASGMELQNAFAQLEGTRAEYEQIIKDTPKQLVMVAGSQPAEGLAKAPAVDLQSPPEFYTRLTQYRDALKSYVASQSKDSQMLANNFDSFHEYLADAQTNSRVPRTADYIASIGLPTKSNGAKSSEPVKVGSFDPEKVKWAGDDVVQSQSERSENLVAVVPAGPPELPNLPGLAGNGGPNANGSVVNTGIFFQDADGTSKRLVNYTIEASRTSRLADVDIDNDADREKVYSYGNNVFIKRNNRVDSEEIRRPFRSVDIEFKTLYELLPAISAPRSVTVTGETAHEVNFTLRKPALAKEIAGYELSAMNGQKRTVQHYLVDSVLPTQRLLTFRMEDVDGTVKINNAPIAGFALAVGDYIETGEDSSMTIRGSDESVMRVAENTSFVLTQGGTFEVQSGSVEVDVPEHGAQFLAPATTVRVVKDAVVRLRFFDGSEITVDKTGPFTLPNFQRARARVTRVTGESRITGSVRQFISSGDDPVQLKPGDRIHPLGVARITWNVDTPSARTLRLSSQVVLPVPEAFSEGLTVKVNDGTIEVLHQEQSTQQVTAGMLIDTGEKIEAQGGSVNIAYDPGGTFALARGETLTLDRTEDRESLALKANLDPGFYAITMTAFDKNGTRSTRSQTVLASPQVCGDTSLPLAHLSTTKYTVLVTKQLTIDASTSFDSQSHVISYFVDTDTTVDSNGDGVVDNDHDISKDSDTTKDLDEDGNPSNDGDVNKLVVGPYDEVGTHSMRLIVRDEGRNEGAQDFTVEVIAPKIVLDPGPARNGVISGHVEPKEGGVPFVIARLRPGVGGSGWQIIRTQTATPDRRYFSDAEGKYVVNDTDMRKRLTVADSAGALVAEIDEATGRMNATDPKFESRFAPAHPPEMPARVGLFEKSAPANSEPLTYVFFVPDTHTDTTLDAPSVVFDANTVKTMHGVHVKPLDAATALGITFSIAPGDDREAPGATIVSKGGKRIALIHVTGEMVSSDPAIGMRLKPAGGATDPVVLELTYNNQAIAEVYIAIGDGSANPTLIVSAPVRVARRSVPKQAEAPPPQEETPPAPPPFSDVSDDDPFGVIARNLFKRGIIAGVRNRATQALEFKPKSTINRAEFTQITLKMLCIVPREEAYKLPAAFYDAIDPKAWFYPVLKEGYIRGFIKGYLGEKQLDAETGLVRAPFKPGNTITRAEATTIVIAALAEQGIIDLNKADMRQIEGGHWYDPYVRIAQDLKPYLIEPNENRAFLLTAGDAADPEHLISREEFAIMAQRVLLMHDCYDVDADPKNDTDEDGLADGWEQRFGLGLELIRPNDDLDGDTCTNQEEFEAGTSPTNPDTDGGGVRDCVEIRSGTDPINNPFDDSAAQDAQDERDVQEAEKAAQEEQAEKDAQEALDDASEGDGGPDAAAAEKSKDGREGAFVVAPTCNVCPCPITVQSGQTITSGDTLFTAITGPNGLPIYATSNQVKF